MHAGSPGKFRHRLIFVLFPFEAVTTTYRQYITLLHPVFASNFRKFFSPGSEIVPFLEDQVIFLTGVTGFLGKVILHKIFSCCEAPGRRGVRKIYVLIRAKRGASARERFDEEVIQKSSILRELKKSMPQMMDKIEVC